MTRALHVTASIACFLMSFVCATGVGVGIDNRSWGWLAVSIVGMLSCFDWGQSHWTKAASR